MGHIQKVSSYLLWVFNIMLIMIPLLAISYWGLIEWAPFKQFIAQGLIIDKPIETPEGLVNISNLKLTPLSRGIGIFGSLFCSVPLFLGIVILKRLFQNYKKGNIFSFENVQNYKYLGWLLFLDALFVKPISNMMMVLAATLSNPTGHRYISVSFGTPNLEDLFWGVLVIVISWVMAEGYKLQEDQSLTV